MILSTKYLSGTVEQNLFLNMQTINALRSEKVECITLLPATGRSNAGQRNSDTKSKFCSWFSASKQQLRIVPETW